MKKIKRKFIGMLALVFMMSFSGFSQTTCDCNDLNYCYGQVNAQSLLLSEANWNASNFESLYNQATEMINSLQSQLNNTVAERDSINSLLTDITSERDAIVYEVNSLSSDEYINLPSGWSMFGYSCSDSIGAVEGFASISDKVEIVKDEWGLSYLPSWEFNAMGNLHYSEGYQIKMIEDVDNFQFCKKIMPFEIGCTDPDAYNYSANATITSNSLCVEKVFGCINEDYLEFNAGANTNDESQCLTPKIFGCVSLFGTNYNPEANVDDGSCIFPIYGCMDENAANFNPSANTDAVVESNTYFTDQIWGEDSNGNIIYYTDTFNDGDLNIVVNSGGYVLWGTAFGIQENSSVTINLNGGLPFNIEDFGVYQISNDNNDTYQYQDCMMLGVEQYNEYYGEFEGLVSSCEELFVFVPMATVSGSNGYSFDISNENYIEYGDNMELWESLSQNLSGSVSITIETEEDIRLNLTSLSIQSVDESSSSCTY